MHVGPLWSEKPVDSNARGFQQYSRRFTKKQVVFHIGFLYQMSTSQPCQIFWRTLKLRLLHKQVDPVYNFQYAYFKAYSNRVSLAVFVNLFTCIARVLNVFLIKAGIIFMVILEQTNYCCEKRNLIWDWFALQVIWWNFNFSNVMD